MADLELVDPSTGATLGTYAFGTVAAGVASTAKAIRLRYKWGQTGSGLTQNAVLIETSDDGGSTWDSDLAEFTVSVTAVQNPSSDAQFAGTTVAARRTSRLDLPPLRAGCAYDLSLVFYPTLRTGAATTGYTYRVGVLYNEGSREISQNPDLPTGVLTGLGDETVREWITAPTLTNDTDKVTLGELWYVWDGVETGIGSGDVTLDQDDGDSATLSSGEEYVAVLSVGAAGTVTTTKGSLATAGSALTPAYPTGELAVAVVRVPYGGVIVTSTLVAVSGRLLVWASGTGRTVYIGTGRAQMPGRYLVLASRQSYTFLGDTTYELYLDESGAPSIVDGLHLATVTTAGGVVTDVTDARLLLYQGQRPKIFADTDVNGKRLYGIGHPYAGTDQYDAATWGSVMQRIGKRSVSVVADADVATLSGEQTVDGVALVAGDRVLLSNQTTTTENGKWIVSADAWTRDYDTANAYQCYAGVFCYVRQGTYARQFWVQTADIADYANDAQVWELMIDLDA